ncbi:MAG: AAA family ATPase [Proteobacteria bacterium]|nr:AAA family ATPase [Pseudomonadota bacterium]
MNNHKIPSPRELEKELNEYLSKKYGDNVRLSVPFLFPDKAETGTEEQEKKKAPSGPKINFDMKPEELESYLNEYVIKQEKAKEILSTKICTHFNRIKHEDDSATVGNIKNNIIMIGPTGVGKTFLIKLIAQKIGVPFVKGDATKFSETGYVGGDVEDLVRDLVREANGDIERAQYGIIYIDEIDKIASSNNLYGPDVSRTGVQRALLKPMEETEVDLKVPHDIVSQMEAVEQYRKTGKRERKMINTKNILFIVSGAFNGLDGERLNSKGLGFGAELKHRDREDELFEQVKSEDLMKYGFESEFIGRLPVVAVFETLTMDDLYAILKNPNSTVINSKKRDFMAYGIDIRFEGDALRKIAEMASEEKTGARGLISAVERVLLKFEKKLPSTEIKKLVVTRAMAEHPAKELKALLSARDGAPLYERHQQLIEQEKDELRERILEKKASLGAAKSAFLNALRLDILVNTAVVKCRDYQKVLDEAILIEGAVKHFEKTFHEQYAIDIQFDETAVNRVLEMVLDDGTDVDRLLDMLLKNYEHGLKLVREKTGRNSFVFPKEAIESPQHYLNNLIRESYQQGA